MSGDEARRSRVPSWLLSSIVGPAFAVFLNSLTNGKVLDALRWGWPYLVAFVLGCGVAVLVARHLFLRRRAADREDAPKATKITLVTPHPGNPGAKTEIHPEVLPPEVRELDERTFHRGADHLHEFLKDKQPHVYHLIVGVNGGGVALASLAGAFKLGRFGIASVVGNWGARKLGSIALPALDTPPADCRVLLVDLTLKTGESLEVVRQRLEADGFKGENIWAAAIVLANIKKIPEGNYAFELTPAMFPQHQAGPPHIYEYWLKRAVFLAFLTGGNPKSPWTTLEK